MGEEMSALNNFLLLFLLLRPMEEEDDEALTRPIIFLAAIPKPKQTRSYFMSRSARRTMDALRRYRKRRRKRRITEKNEHNKVNRWAGRKTIRRGKPSIMEDG